MLGGYNACRYKEGIMLSFFEPFLVKEIVVECKKCQKELPEFSRPEGGDGTKLLVDSEGSCECFPKKLEEGQLVEASVAANRRRSGYSSTPWGASAG